MKTISIRLDENDMMCLEVIKASKHWKYASTSQIIRTLIKAEAISIDNNLNYFAEKQSQSS